MSEGKKRLLELEKTGKYFFHGTPYGIEVFEPRQSHNDINGELVKDGDPAVSASSSIDYAIFMAIFNLKNCPKGFTSKADISAESKNADVYQISFLANKKGLNQLTDDSSGFVYIFDKNSFPFKHGPAEYRSSTHVSPIEKIVVKKEDLPEVKELSDKIITHDIKRSNH